MMPTRKNANSLGYFNLARGVGILVVLAGHTANLFKSSIVDRGTPLFGGAGLVFGGGILIMFFLISGFGFYPREPKKCFALQVKMLLKPYYVVAGLVILTRWLRTLIEELPFWKYCGKMIPTYLLGLNAAGGQTYFGVLVDSVSIFWFIWALFGGWIIYNGIYQLKSQRLQYGLVAACSLAGYLLCKISKVWPFCFSMMLLTVGFLFLGVQIRQHKLLERPLPIWAWIALCIPVGISLAWGYVDMGMCTWRLGLLDLIGSICLGFLLMRGFSWIVQRDIHGGVISLLEKAGFNSIWLIYIHAYEKAVFPWREVTQTLCNKDTPFLNFMLCFLLRCLIISLIYLLFDQINHIKQRRKRRKRPKIIIE